MLYFRAGLWYDFFWYGISVPISSTCVIDISAVSISAHHLPIYVTPLAIV